MDFTLSLVLAADAATAAIAAFNATELTLRRAGEVRAVRRNALSALAALNGGIAVQAAFAYSLYAAYALDLSTAPFFASGAWLAARLPLLMATLGLALIIVRDRR